MKCVIECSFGEIVDKYTILKIKLEKVKNKKQEENIKNEYNKLIKFIKKDDKLFNKLYKINKILWDLEDKIREKSSKKEFDNEYIICAENIHITNDKRYLIKKEINEKYNSELKEEKIYI